ILAAVEVEVGRVPAVVEARLEVLVFGLDRLGVAAPLDLRLLRALEVDEEPLAVRPRDREGRLLRDELLLVLVPERLRALRLLVLAARGSERSERGGGERDGERGGGADVTFGAHGIHLTHARARRGVFAFAT